jgi:general stress protein 26
MEENKKIILDFIKSQFILNLATANEGKPASSVMLYTADDDLNFYIATHRNSYKSQNLIKNPVASISIWEHNKMLVQSDVSVSEVTNPETADKILDALADQATEKKDFWPPVFRIKGDDYVIFKLSPTWIRGLDLTRNTVHQDDSPFIEVKL